MSGDSVYGDGNMVEGDGLEQGELVQLSREELETFRMQMKAMAMVAKDQAKKSRELEIKQKLMDIKSSAIKRTAGLLMHWLYDLEDLEEVWLPVAAVAKETGLFVAREDNLKEINQNLKDQGLLLTALKEKMKTELTWQIVAAKSLLNWKLVKFAEGGDDYDKEWLSMSDSDIKSLEHSYAQRQRDLTVAMKAANARGTGEGRHRGGRDSHRRYSKGSHGEANERGRSETEEEKARRFAKVECYNCNKLGHFAWGCPDKKKKRSRDETSRN